MSFRLRLILSLLVVQIGLFFYLTDWIQSEVRPRSLESLEESLNDLANTMASVIELDSSSGTLNLHQFKQVFELTKRREVEAQIYKFVKTAVDIEMYITDAKGIVIYDSLGKNEQQDFSQWNNIARTLSGSYGARSTRTNPENPATSMMHISAPIRVKDRLIGVVTVVKPPTSANAFIDAAKLKVNQALASLFVAMIVIVLMVGFWVSSPIKRLTEYVRAMAESKVTHRPRFSSSELKELSASFEDMKASLDGRSYIESYVQNLTHEIKSPLTGIKSAAELLQGPMDEESRSSFVKNIELDMERIQSIVTRLSDLSALERATTSETSESVDLEDLIDSVALNFGSQLEKKALKFALEVERGLSVVGDRLLLSLALVNLLQNAVEFSDAASTISVRAYKDTKTGLAIEVRNVGPLIPSFALQKVLDRFYSLPRPSTGRKSSGLGLSFVQEIMRLHEGVVVLANWEHGVLAKLTFKEF